MMPICFVRAPPSLAHLQRIRRVDQYHDGLNGVTGNGMLRTRGRSQRRSVRTADSRRYGTWFRK
jgi:hypothetical protein